MIGRAPEALGLLYLPVLAPLQGEAVGTFDGAGMEEAEQGGKSGGATVFVPGPSPAPAGKWSPHGRRSTVATQSHVSRGCSLLQQAPASRGMLLNAHLQNHQGSPCLGL